MAVEASHLHNPLTVLFPVPVAWDMEKFYLGGYIKYNTVGTCFVVDSAGIQGSINL
jgi:hypothetical protein